MGSRQSADVKRLLEALGLASVEDLFAEIPPELRWERPVRVPEALPESQLTARLAELMPTPACVV